MKKHGLKIGQVIWFEHSKFPHIITHVDPYDWYIWCRPVGAVDNREKRKHVSDVDHVDKFMTEVYSAKQEKDLQEAASVV